MDRLRRPLRTLAVACLLAAGALPAATRASSADDAIASLQQAFTRAVAPGEQADFYRNLFPTVLQRVERSHAKPVDVPALAALAAKALEPLPAGGDPREVFTRSVNEALRTLDNYTRYLDPRSYDNQRGESTGSFGGVGLQLEPGAGLVRVTSTVPDGPAARAGVLVGDVILQVDDRPLAGGALADVVSRLRGEPGTPVTLVLRRADREFTLALTRDTIRTQPLRASMEGDVLVLKVSTFSAPVSAAVDKAVRETLATHAPRAIVLDVRGNPGGLLREAVRTADAFLAQGEIVSVRGRATTPRTWTADADQLLPGLPMVVLIDRQSASASELLAAALQENGRATVMGQRSYGKGTVQVTYPLGDRQGAVRMTTSTYHAPSGRGVQDSGVVPDIELTLASGSPAAAGEAAARWRMDQSRCAALPGGADPALACAVAYLRAGGLEGLTAALADAAP